MRVSIIKKSSLQTNDKFSRADTLKLNFQNNREDSQEQIFSQTSALWNNYTHKQGAA